MQALTTQTKQAAGHAAAASKSAPDRLAIGEPDSSFEREADRMAEQVMAPGRAPNGSWSIANMGIENSLNRKCSCGDEPESESGKEEDERNNPKKTVQSKAETAGGAGVAPPIVHQVLRSSARPLDTSTRQFFETRFGHDFGAVRVHNDADAS